MFESGVAATLNAAPIVAPWMALAVLISMLARAWHPFRKLNLEREAGEVMRLTVTVERLDAELKQVRAEQARDREIWRTEQAIMRKLHEKELSEIRHQRNHLAQILKSMADMLEMNPDRAPEITQRLRIMMADNIVNGVREDGL